MFRRLLLLVLVIIGVHGMVNASGVRYALSAVNGNDALVKVTILPGTRADSGYYYGCMTVPLHSECTAYISRGDGTKIPVVMRENGCAGTTWYQWFRFDASQFQVADTAVTATMYLHSSIALTTVLNELVPRQSSVLHLAGADMTDRRLKKSIAALRELPFTYGLKIFVDRDGVYELSSEYLKKHGVPLGSIDARTIRMYEGNREIPISITNEQHRVLTNDDRILFYGKSLRSPDGGLLDYSETNCYWLTWGNSVGARAAVVSGARREDPSQYRTSRLVHAGLYEDTVHFEKDEMLIWLGNVADQPTAELTDDPGNDPFNGGKWYQGIVGAKDLTTFTFTCAAPAKRKSARIRVGMMGMSSIDSVTPDHDVALFINDKPAGATNRMRWDGQRYAVFESDTFSTDLLVHGENRITMQTFAPRGADRTAFDWIEVRYIRGYEAIDDIATFKSYAFAAGSLVEYTVEGFSSGDIDLWDISTGRRFTGYIVEAGNNSNRGRYRLVFQDSIRTSVNYYVQTISRRIRTPMVSLDTIVSQWDTLTACNYVVISTDSFYTELKPLLEMHQKNGLKAAFVAVEDIYNRFTGGVTDPEAIRLFLQYIADAGGHVEYLLLGGDCTHNLYKKDKGRTVVPTHLSRMPGWGPGADDGYFSLVNNDLFPDCSVGRFPAQNRDEMRALVQKNIDFRQHPDRGYWRDNMLLLGGGGAEFTAFNDQIASGNAAEQIMLARMDADPASSYYIEGVRAPGKIADYCNTGMYIVNFNGHGGGNVWSDNDFFGFNDIPLLHNGQWKGGRLPIVLSFTCLTGFFESADYRSLGEEFLRREGDGAIAFYGASAYTSQNGNLIMNRLFIEEILSGAHTTIGELITFCEMSMIVRYQTGYLHMARQYNLLGDPALPLYTVPDSLRLTCSADADEGTLKVSGTCHPVDSGEVRIALVANNSQIDHVVVPVKKGVFEHSLPLKNTIISQVASVRAYAWNDHQAVRGSIIYTKDTLSVDKVRIFPATAAFNDTVTVSCSIASSLGVDSGIQVFCMYAVSERQVEDTDVRGVPMSRQEDGTWKSVDGIIPVYSGNVNERLMLFFRVVTPTTSVQSRLHVFTLRGRPDCLISSPRMSVVWNGDALAVPFTVQNVGSGPAAPFTTALIWKPKNGVGDTIGTVATHEALAPGARNSFVITLPDTSGTLSFEVVIDPLGDIEEMTKENNRVEGRAVVWYADCAKPTDALRIDSGLVTIVPVDSFASSRRIFVIQDTIAAEMPLATSSVWHARWSGQMVKWYFGVRPALTTSDSLRWKCTLPAVTGEDTLQQKAAFMIYDTTIGRWRCHTGVLLSKAKTTLTMKTVTSAWYSRALLSDNTAPELMLSVYGKTLATLDYTAKDRPFSVMLSDPSSIMPASVKLLLNKKKLDDEDHSKVPESGDLRSVTVSAYPNSERRIDSLVVECSDLAGNRAVRTFAYLPGRDLSIVSFTCHPNPFTARRNGDGSIAKIRFAFLLTDIASSVSLSIFTVSGKKIRTWSDDELIGYQQIEWDGRDHEGYRIANGTYYAKLTVKNERKKDTKIIRIAKLEGF